MKKEEASQPNEELNLLRRRVAEPAQVEAQSRRIEEKLRLERDFNATLIQAAPLFFVAIGADGRTLMMNETMLQALGYTAAEVVDRDYLTTFVPERDRESLSRIFTTLTTSHEPTLNKNCVLTRDGRELLVEWHGRQVFKEDSALDFFFGVGVDITEGKDAEKRIDHLNRVLRAIRNVNQLIVREKDRDMLIQRTCELLIETCGYHHACIALIDEAAGFTTATEAGLGNRFLPLVEQLKQGEWPACMRRALTQSEPVVTEDPSSMRIGCPSIEEDAGTGTLTVRLEHAGKVYGMVSASVTREGIANEEEQGLFKEVADDIAFALHNIEVKEKQVKAEAALQQSERLLSGIFDSVQDGISVLDANLTIRRTNEIMRRWYAENLPLEGKKCYECYQHRESRCDPSPTLRCIRSGRTEHNIVPGLEGSPVQWIELFSYPMKDPESGEVLGVVEFVRDITARVRAEKALQESEVDLHDAQRIAKMGRWELDLVSGHLQWSPTIFEIFEIDPKEFGASYEAFIETIHPDDRESVDQAYSNSLKNQTPYNIEHRLLMKDGRIKWLNEICRNDYDADGKAIRSIGIVQDITVRKQAEEMIVQERNRAQTYLDVVAVIMIALDSEGHIELVNNQGSVMLGYSEQELLGKDWLETCLPDRLRSDVRGVFRRLMSGDADPVEYYESPILTKNGQERIIAWHNVVLRDDTGKITGTLSSGQDITERKKAEAALHASEERYRGLFEHVPVGLCRVTSEGRIIDANPALVEMLGYPDREELLAVNMAELYMKPEDRQQVLTRLAREGVLRHLELPMRRRDSAVLWVELNVRAISDAAGRVLYHEKHLGNIIKRKQAEEALRLRFVNLAETISHIFSLRNPYVATHLQGTAKLTRAVGKKMGLDEERLQNLYIGSLLHDIGKVAIPEVILRKPGELNEAEWGLVRTHPRLGYDILKNANLPWPAAELALHHHERLDGSGYPDGLKGDELSMEARILIVCNVVDSMSLRHPYRPARSKEEIADELRRGVEGEYDPEVVSILLEMIESGELKLAE